MNWKGYCGKWLWSTLKYYPSVCMEGLRKIIKILVRLAGCWAEIWVQDLPNVRRDSYTLLHNILSVMWCFMFVSRSAVQTCQEDDDDAVVLSSEERQKVLEAKQSQIRQIVGMCGGALHKMFFAWQVHVGKQLLVPECSVSMGLVSNFQTLSPSPSPGLMWQVSHLCRVCSQLPSWGNCGHIHMVSGGLL